MKILLHTLAISLLWTISLISAKPIEADAVVASFAEAPIYAEEMTFHIRDHVALVAVYFKYKHGVDLAGENWLRKFGGETPLEILKDRAVRSCQLSKATQQLAIKQKVAEKLPFPRFGQFCDELNLARARALVEGEVLHGLKSYSPTQLYKYMITNMRISLLNRSSRMDHQERENEVKEKIEKAINKLQPRLDEANLNRLLAEQIGATAEH